MGNNINLMLSITSILLLVGHKVEQGTGFCKLKKNNRGTKTISWMVSYVQRMHGFQ